MNQQPDKFFKEKLQGYQKGISPDAWQRVSRQLDKKNTFPLWMKVAASLLLLSTAGIFIILPNDPTPGTVATNTASKIENKTSTLEKALTPSGQAAGDPEPEKAEASTTSRNAEAQPKAPSPQRKSPATPENTSTPPGELPEAEPAHANREPLAVIKDNASDVLAHPSPTEENKINSENVAVQDTDKKSITLVYTAAEVNEKYFEKRSVTQATPEEDKTSTLKKLLDKAYDLKNNQDPLGDLRQKKNEILAFNFRGDKQRKN